MGHLREESLIIRTDANVQIGTGHLMRCLALAQAWKDAGGEVVFITACQSDDLLQRLREEGFNICLLARPYPEPGDWDYTKDILAAHPNAWVVLDGYHFGEIYQQRVKEAGHRLLVIDDMAHLKHYYADFVLNQNLHAEQLHYSCESYTRLLLGTRYVLLRREFLAWRGWKREIPEVARRVLVTLGGGDPENHTLKVIQALQKVDTPGLEATVVIGASSPYTDVLSAAIKQSFIPIRLVCNAKNMPELMTWADVAVSGGGVTCWELVYMLLPILVVVLAPNQEANARALQESGIALIFSIEHIQRLLLDRKMHAAMSQIGRSIVDGHGVEHVTKILRTEE